MELSVLIPCWNEERTIYHSIYSVTHLADEIIVWDDGSTDNSLNEIKKAIEDFPSSNIRYRTGHRLGVNPNVRNELVNLSSNSLCVTMDADCCFIKEFTNYFVDEISTLIPGEVKKFSSIDIGHNLNCTTENVQGGPDVFLTAFIKSDNTYFYPDKEGFAQIKAEHITPIRHPFVYHFKFNKSNNRKAMRCVYRDSVKEDRDINEMFKEKYDHIDLDKYYSKKKEQSTEIPLPDELKFDIYKKVVDYANRF